MAENESLYSSKIISTFLKLIRDKYTYVNVPELLAKADMEDYQVEDEDHWFSQNQVDRFYKALVDATGNPHMAREAGRYAASPVALGTMSRYVLGFIGPAKAFELVEKISGRYTRSSTYKSRKLDSTGIEIIVTPAKGIREESYQCENRIGYFEAVIRLFNYRAPRIEHPECIFKGGSTCRYVITWQASLATIIRRWMNVAYIAAAGISIHSLFYEPGIPLKFLTPSLFMLLLFLSIVGERLQRRELVATIDNLRDTMDNLLEAANDNYNHALTINEIGQAISKQIKIDDILSRVNEVFRKRLDYDRGLILLQNKDKTLLEYRDGFGYREDDVEMMKTASFHLNKEGSRGVFVICHKEQKPFLVNDINEISAELSARSLEFAKKMGSKSFICCPIIFENESLGVVAVDNIRTKRPLIQSDINLLMGIAPEMGIAIHNALLVEEQEKQFQSIIQTLAASIDARDFLTAGHSERVTEYAVGICQELGLARDYTEMIRVAAQLHDYGKIGIEDSILKKAGPLSEAEKKEIETHAEKTENILRRINFEGIYREVPFIAGSHHEKLNGTGYPRGLSADQIPLGSRIIAVADFFEAITAKRHYRSPMSHEEALQTLMLENGTHFDSEIVHAFVSYLLRENQIRADNPV